MTDLPTPGAILDFWIGPASEDAIAAKQKNKLWFIKSADTDAKISARYGGLIDLLNGSLANEWAKRGSRGRLAAIIVLDQFSRNMFRANAKSFAYDATALRLANEGLSQGDDRSLTEIERSFFYLPLEHSERLADQDDCVNLFEQLSADARPAFSAICNGSLDYARRHREVICQFGRFPHRNAILGRKNTAAEQIYLDQPGSGF